jgi:glycosyltransferase involved in cell wall biosynthesis
MAYKKVLIDALYINTGGAKVILETVIAQLHNRGILNNYIFLIDARLNSNLISFIDNANLFIINASVWSHKRFYLNNKKDFNKVVCLANLPPPIAIEDKPVYILFHNAHILKSELSWPQLISITKYAFKRTYILLMNKRKYSWVVQTETMKKLIEKNLFIYSEKIRVIPFYKQFDFDVTNRVKKENLLSFAYIADGQIQKNHKFLIKVFRHLYLEHGLNVTLYLTVSNNYPNLIKEITYLNQIGIFIINLGTISHKEIIELYKKVDYLLYPSLIESFGLPLIEASSMGCDVIAINKDYVYDVITPSAVFSTKNIYELSNMIISLYNGKKLPKTKLVVNNSINEFVDLLI